MNDNFENRDFLMNNENSLNDCKIEYYEELITPNHLQYLLPNNNRINEFISKSRNEIKDILNNCNCWSMFYS